MSRTSPGLAHGTGPHIRIVSFLWGIADDVLRDLFRRGKYPDVILPMAVVRRLDEDDQGAFKSKAKAFVRWPVAFTGMERIAFW